MIDISASGDSVTVTYRDGDKSASATVVGGSVDDVEQRADQIVENHDLKSKASANNSE